MPRTLLGAANSQGGLANAARRSIVADSRPALRESARSSSMLSRTINLLWRAGRAHLLCTAIWALPCVARPAESDTVRTTFREVDTLFANPGQGWMSQQRTPRGEPRFPCSVVYVRFN